MFTAFFSTVRRRRYLSYAAVFGISMMLSTFDNVIPVLRGTLQAYLGIGDERFGLLRSVGSLGGAVAVIFTGGFLLDRLGPVVIIRWALRAAALGMGIIAGGGHDWRAVLVSAVVLGAAIGPLGMAGILYLSRLFPKEKCRVVSLYLVVMGVGGVLLPMVGEGMLWSTEHLTHGQFGLPFKLPFGIVAILLFLLSLAYRNQGRTRTYHARQAAAASRDLAVAVGWRSYLLPWVLLLPVLCLSIHGALDTSIWIWMPRFLSSSCFTTPMDIPGMTLSGVSLAYLVSRSLLSLAPGNWGRNALMVLPGLMGGAILLAGLIYGSASLVAFSYVAGAFFWSVEYPTFMSSLTEEARSQFGKVQAYIAIIGGVLLFGISSGVGVIAASFGEKSLFPCMIAMASGFCLVGILGAFYVSIRHAAKRHMTGGIVDPSLQTS